MAQASNKVVVGWTVKSGLIPVPSATLGESDIILYTEDKDNAYVKAFEEVIGLQKLAQAGDDDNLFTSCVDAMRYLEAASRGYRIDHRGVDVPLGKGVEASGIFFTKGTDIYALEIERAYLEEVRSGNGFTYRLHDLWADRA